MLYFEIKIDPFFCRSGIMDLSDTSFDSRETLSFVFDVPRRKLNVIPNGLLNGQKKIRINSKNLQAGSFVFLKNLKHLDLSCCSIKEVKNGLFNGLANLEVLQLNNNQIKFIEKNAFSNLTKLKFLNLADGHLTRINSKIFDDLISLEGLNLSRNKIEGIDRKAFIGLKSLIFLDMSDNKIKEIKASRFESLTRLKTLYLQDNKIEHFESEIFAKLTNLKLFLIYNQGDLTFFRINSEILWSIYKKISQNKYLRDLLVSKASYRYDLDLCPWKDGLEVLEDLKIFPKLDILKDNEKFIDLILEAIFKDKLNRIVMITKKLFCHWHEVKFYYQKFIFNRMIIFIYFVFYRSHVKSTLKVDFFLEEVFMDQLFQEADLNIEANLKSLNWIPFYVNFSKVFSSINIPCHLLFTS